MALTKKAASKFGAFTSQPGNGLAIVFKPATRARIYNLGYSFQDLAHVLGTAANTIVQSRIAIVLGEYQELDFTPTTDLVEYQVLADFFIGDTGPSVLGFSADADDTPTIDPGHAATILLATPLVFPAQATQLVAKLYAASGRTHSATPLSVAPGAPNSNGPGSGSGGAAGSATGGTSNTGGNTGRSGGGQRIAL